MLKKQNITIAGRRTSLVMDVYFWDCLQTLLWQETISLNDFCMKVDRCRRHSSLTSAMKLVILIYYRSLASFTVGADGIFATDLRDITDITGMTQQLHAPDAAPAPVRLLPLVLQKFAIIEAHAE
ncbi:MAG: ribbon-helix-helix domain-containing protein [Alphaproteobacteria bacterium]|nr:ribbon-helix-helix domain-containing protein [Alphaproteobacteria bacterium]